MPGDTLHRDATSLDSSLLVSVIVVAHAGFEGGEPALLPVARLLRERYAFYELLLIGPAGLSGAARGLMESLASVVPQIRYLHVEDGADFDRMATHGYAECIGDVIVVTSAEELPYMELSQILDRLRSGASLVRLRRRRSNSAQRLISFLVRSVTGLQVDTRFHRTLGLGRQLLSELLARPDEIHLFRFKAPTLFSRQAVIDVDMPATRGGLALVLRRVDLLARLVATSAPRLLRVAAAVSFAVSVAAFLALLYVAAVWLFKPDVAEGWTTTASLIALWMFVQLGASAVICLGLSRMLDRQERARPPRILDETTVSDLFNTVGLLNVERGRPAAENA